MQSIIITGTLLEDAEPGQDKNGLNFTRFTVTCGETGANERAYFTHYKCTCYLKGYDNLKKKDQVTVTGKVTIRISKTKDTNEPYLNINVLVHSISRGYTAEERKKR